MGWTCRTLSKINYFRKCRKLLVDNSDPIEKLISMLGKLPGLGPRSARRATLFLLTKKDLILRPLYMAIKNVLENISLCKTCGNACTDQVCKICSDPKRDKNLICVVEDVSDLWAIERTRSFKGVFHVLGGTLSAIESIGPEEINIIELQKRVLAESGEKELILALNATLEGQTTSHYIADLFKDTNIKVTSLAKGVPIGGELDYLDEGTISAALTARKDF